jgi:hypothetical protein
MSYGFMVYDDIITDEEIKKTIEYINSNKSQGENSDRTYSIVKSEKVHYDGKNLKLISSVF